MRHPDFFIIGAPKSGTTALYHYLKQHPDIFAPDLKEPHFFAPDLDSGEPSDARYFIRDQTEYGSHFLGATTQKRIGEASVFYLYSHEAATRIYNFNPDARIIALLREPVEMIYSLHAQHLASGTEDIIDFEEALEAEAPRRAGRLHTKNRITQKCLHYRAVARYGEQIERFLNVFPREQMLILAYDHFRHDTPGTFREVLNFLEVDDSFAPSFDIVNPTKRVRSMALRDFIYQPPWWADRAAHLALPSRRVRHGLSRRLWEFNTPPSGGRPPLCPLLRARLAEEFAPDVMHLSSLTGRDFNALWAPRSAQKAASPS